MLQLNNIKIWNLFVATLRELRTLYNRPERRAFTTQANSGGADYVLGLNCKSFPH